MYTNNWWDMEWLKQGLQMCDEKDKIMKHKLQRANTSFRRCEKKWLEFRDNRANRCTVNHIYTFHLKCIWIHSMLLPYWYKVIWLWLRVKLLLWKLKWIGLASQIDIILMQNCCINTIKLKQLNREYSVYINMAIQRQEERETEIRAIIKKG